MQACYRALIAAYDELGCPPGRMPTEWQEAAIERLPEFRDICDAIKRALDVNGVIAPGKYGIA